MKLLFRIGIFRLVLIPLGLYILYTAWAQQIWGMGVVGVVVLVFGFLNKCLLTGKCDVTYEDKDRKAK